MIVTGANPYIANNNLNLDPASCSSLEITYKATGIKAPNHCRLFFGTEKNQVLDEAKKIYIGSLVCDGKWRTVTVNAENTHGGRDLWFNHGAITKLRLDFCSRNSGEFIIKSIKPIYSRATDFRNTLIKRGIPAQVPVKLGRNGEDKIEVIFDKNLIYT